MSNFSKDGITDTWRWQHKFFIIHEDGRIYAMTAICSHKHNTLRLKDGHIVCPSHGSHFSDAGIPTKGPARLPLCRYGISQDASGHLIVDKSRRFEEKEWDQPGAFIPVEKPKAA